MNPVKSNLQVCQIHRLGRTPLLVGLLAGAKEQVVTELLEHGEDPTKEDQVGRGCPEAAMLYCNASVLKIILSNFLQKEGVSGVSKKLLLDIADDRSDNLELKKVVLDLTKHSKVLKSYDFT